MAADTFTVNDYLALSLLIFSLFSLVCGLVSWKRDARELLVTMLLIFSVFFTGFVVVDTIQVQSEVMTSMSPASSSPDKASNGITA